MRRNYECTEQALETAAKHGDLQGVKRVMKEHHKYEYALLYKIIKKGDKRK